MPFSLSFSVSVIMRADRESCSCASLCKSFCSQLLMAAEHNLTKTLGTITVVGVCV